MSGYLNSDGSGLVGGLLPSKIGEALNLDANGNLLVSTAAAGGAQVATGNATADGDAVSIALSGDQDTVLVQVLGIFVLTVLFEASPDSGVTWYSVSGVTGTGTIASSATAPGYWRVNVAGFTNFRARSHPITSGTAAITLQLSQAVNNVSILNATALGQATSANSAPVVIASDQNVPVKAATLEVIGNGTGVVNAINTDLIPSTDVSAYKWLSLQIQGTYSATLTFQGSNDNVNFVAVKLLNIGSFVDNNASSTTSGTGQIWAGPITYRFLRVRATSFVSNASLAGTLELWAIAPTIPITVESVLVQASALGLGTNDFHLVSAASNNATSIKASGGQVYGYEITNTNAAIRFVKLYNKASAPNPAADTPFRTIGVPANGGRASFHSSTGLNMGTGIAVAAVTGISDTDNTSVGAADLVIDIDWK
ncbi:MAG: hypothetical protein ABI413_05840 [Ktedonobacteraceae bacterium]